MVGEPVQAGDRHGGVTGVRQRLGIAQVETDQLDPVLIGSKPLAGGAEHRQGGIDADDGEARVGLNNSRASPAGATTHVEHPERAGQGAAGRHPSPQAR